MPLTLMVAPMIVQEAKSYAEANGTTLDSLVEAYFKDIVQRERKRQRAHDDLMAIPKAWIPDPDMDKALQEMRTIDLEMWK